MRNILKIFFTIVITAFCSTEAQEFLYILNDKCINQLYITAEEHFKHSTIKIIRDPRGLILRDDFQDKNEDFYTKIKNIENFLAKIENPAIIEVHTGDFPEGSLSNLKRWEFSTIIANDIEAFITKPKGSIPQKRINSVGYGEFLPAKNTPNNGGKYLNRIDIIVLCNISGE